MKTSTFTSSMLLVRVVLLGFLAAVMVSCAHRVDRRVDRRDDRHDIRDTRQDNRADRW